VPLKRFGSGNDSRLRVKKVINTLNRVGIDSIGEKEVH
jgi:hypothetical protein